MKNQKNIKYLVKFWLRSNEKAFLSLCFYVLNLLINDQLICLLWIRPIRKNPINLILT